MKTMDKTCTAFRKIACCIDKICIVFRMIAYHVAYMFFVAFAFDFSESAYIIIACSLGLMSALDAFFMCSRGKSFRRIFLIVFVVLIARRAVLALQANPALLEFLWPIEALILLRILLCMIFIPICKRYFAGEKAMAPYDMHAAIMGHIAFAILPIMFLLRVLLPSDKWLIAASVTAAWTIVYAVLVVTHIRKYRKSIGK